MYCLENFRQGKKIAPASGLRIRTVDVIIFQKKIIPKLVEKSKFRTALSASVRVPGDFFAFEEWRAKG
jgi:hypothetical protein